MSQSPETFFDLARHVDDLIASLLEHPDESVREQVVLLLGGLDALHREGLTRLTRRLRATGAGEALDHASADPVVQALLGLYDLAELPLPDEKAPPRKTGLVQLRVPGRRPAE